MVRMAPFHFDSQHINSPSFLLHSATNLLKAVASRLCTSERMHRNYSSNHDKYHGSDGRRTYLEKVNKVKENESIDWRKLIDKRHTLVDVVAVSYSSQVHVGWNQWRGKFAEPQFEQRRGRMWISERRRRWLPLVTEHLQSVHFIRVA